MSVLVGTQIVGLLTQWLMECLYTSMFDNDCFMQVLGSMV